MADLEEGKREFHRRPDRPEESICLSCFLTVRAAKPRRLEDAEDAHRRVCINHMDIPENRNFIT